MSPTLSLLLPRFDWGALNSNHHIWRKGKFGWKSRTRRKGCSVVVLGKGYRERHVYGLRFWRYRTDGSCWNFDIYFWDGKQQGSGAIIL